MIADSRSKRGEVRQLQRAVISCKQRQLSPWYSRNAWLPSPDLCPVQSTMQIELHR